MGEISDQNAGLTPVERGREVGEEESQTTAQFQERFGQAIERVLEPKSPIAGAACLTRWPCLGTPGVLSQSTVPPGWPMGSVASARACSRSQKSDRRGSQSRSAECYVFMAITVRPSRPQLHFSMRGRKQHLHGTPGPCSRGKLNGANYSPHRCLGSWGCSWYSSSPLILS